MSSALKWGSGAALVTDYPFSGASEELWSRFLQFGLFESITPGWVGARDSDQRDLLCLWKGRLCFFCVKGKSLFPETNRSLVLQSHDPTPAPCVCVDVCVCRVHNPERLSTQGSVFTQLQDAEEWCSSTEQGKCLGHTSDGIITDRATAPAFIRKQSWRPYWELTGMTKAPSDT